jgi:hypothetical protein
MNTITKHVTGGGFGRRLFLTITFWVCLVFLLATPRIVRAVQENAASSSSSSSSSSEYATERNRDAAWDNERADEAADAYWQTLWIHRTSAAYRLGWCYNEQQKHGDAEWALKDAVRWIPPMKRHAWNSDLPTGVPNAIKKPWKPINNSQR